MTTQNKLKQYSTRAICGAMIGLTLVPNALALTPNYTTSESFRNDSYYTALKNVTLTGNQRSDIVAVAKSQLNYTEGNSKKQLSGFANGDGNFTEYGTWYGSHSLWCATFVSYCAAQAGISTSIIPKHAFTVDGLNFFIDKGQAYSRQQVANGTYTPQAGDLVYFKGSRNNNKTNHVGIVTGYSNNTLYTIEGNTTPSGSSSNGGGVYAKSYDISNTYVVYICSPGYTSSSPLSSLISVIPSSNQIIPTITYGDPCYPRCSSSCTTITSGLSNIGVDSSYAHRKQIAIKNGVNNYQGTASQNNHLLALLKAGNLKKPSSGSTPNIVLPTPGTSSGSNTSNSSNPSSSSTSSAYYPRCSSSCTTITAGLSNIGVDSSYAHRKQIAIKNGVSNYQGTAAQNNHLLALLKAGNLKRA